MGKIITLWSPANYTGVTTTAILLADKLSKEKTVCLIDLDLNNPDTTLYLNISDAEHNLDNLFPYIEGNALTEEIFKMNLVKIRDFLLLQGTKKIDKGPTFKITELEPIINIAKELFDIVVINTSSSLDNAGTFLSIKKADKLVMVVNQNIFHFRKFIEKSQLIGSLFKNMFVIVNKFNKNIVLSLENIEENLNIPVYPLSYVDNVNIANGINAQESLFNIFDNKKTKKYQKEITVIKDKLLVELGYKKEDEIEVKKKRLFFKK